MIDVSGSELFAVAAKALLGAGAGQALADDGAKAALWLHAKGYNGTRAVVDASRGTTSASALGITAVDLLVSRSAPRTSVDDIASPLLLMGLLGVASSHHGLRFSAQCASQSEVVTLTPTTVSGPVDTIEGSINLACWSEEGDRTHEGARALRLSVADGDWQAVADAAARIYVPSNERSRATGAGAGLIDTD